MTNIIVTLTDRNNNFEYDVEVPTDLVFENLVDDLLQTVLSYNPDLENKSFKSELYIPKLSMYKMRQGDTLDSIGVFNGDYLVIA